MTDKIIDDKYRGSDLDILYAKTISSSQVNMTKSLDAEINTPSHKHQQPNMPYSVQLFKHYMNILLRQFQASKRIQKLQSQAQMRCFISSVNNIKHIHLTAFSCLVSYMIIFTLDFLLMMVKSRMKIDPFFYTTAH